MPVQKPGQAAETWCSITAIHSQGPNTSHRRERIRGGPEDGDPTGVSFTGV